MKRLGLADFLELKERRGNETQTKEYISDLLGGTIQVKKISPYKITEMMDKARENGNEEMTAGLKANMELIYKHCPDFQNKELLTSYECVEPYDIVLKIFDNNIGSINDFANYILSLYGMYDYKEKKETDETEVGDDIKNS